MTKTYAVKTTIEEVLKAAEFRGDEPQPEFCNIERCGREAVVMSLCNAHYHRYQRYLQANPRAPRRDIGSERIAEVMHYMIEPVGPHEIKVKDLKCHVPGCYGRKYEARGLCRMHYSRFANAARRGDVVDPEGRIKKSPKERIPTRSYMRKDADKLSGTQETIVNFILDCNAEGFGPSYKDIIEHIGLSSVSSAHYHLKRLEHLGWIRMGDGRARRVEVLKGIENEDR